MISLRFCRDSGCIMGTRARCVRLRQVLFSALAARKSIREAHDAYKGSRWLEAARKDEEIAAADPSLSGAHFFLANSYENLFKPSRAGEPENDGYMQKAVERAQGGRRRKPTPRSSGSCSTWWRPTGRTSSTTPAEAEPIVKR